MPIQSADFHWYKSALISDAAPASNGGRASTVESVSGVKNNAFPDVSAAQRAAGVEHWRKLFITVKNADNLPLVDPLISIFAPTPGDSYVLLYPGTDTDTQDALSARPYGYATLAADASAGASSISITTEVDYSALAEHPFQVGDRIRLDARTVITGTESVEYLTIASITGAGADLTLGLTAPLVFSYTAGASVASVIEAADLAASVESVTTTGTTTFDHSAHPITTQQAGVLAQTWTLTITDASTGAFSLSGDTLGTGLATGATGVDFAPANPAGGTYFTVPAAGWGGTLANGDTLTFTTQPAHAPAWYHRIVPVGASAISSDPVVVCVEGESA